MLLNKYKRTNFMPTVDGGMFLEKDIVSNNWDLFETKRPITFVTFTRQDLQRPDNFAIRVYGTSDFWWILAKYNLIDDWWNDVVVGNTIAVPDRQDINDFYLKTKARIRKNGNG
jgi:hypothetical protein